MFVTDNYGETFFIQYFLLMWQCTAKGKELAKAFHKLIIDMDKSEQHYNPEHMEVRRQ